MRASHIHLGLAWWLLLGGCTGVIAGVDDAEALCEVSEVAAPPLIERPALGEYLQPEELLQIEASTGANASSEAQLVEFEVWAVSDTGPIAKTWSGSLSGAGLALSIDLTQGDFEPGFTALQSWRSYGVRARTRDGGELCDFGAWSEFQAFKIDDGSEAIFDDQIIRDVQISLSQASFDIINAEAEPPGCVPYHRPYHPGTVTFDGTTFDNAGVRVKGGCGSSRPLTKKASFKINLSDYDTTDDCPDTRRARGLKRLTLNNQVQDPSFLHERLAYHLYDLAGVPVPRRAPIRVHVNDELWGLYLHLESIDRRFFKRRFESTAAEGMLYEGTYFCDLTPENLPAIDGPETCFASKFNSECSTPDPAGDPYNYAPLISFVGQIDAFPSGGYYPAIRDLVDFDSFLSQWAVESIINHWDGGIFDILNNYRVYHDPLANKWVMLPTGLDQSFNPGQRPIDPWVPNSIIARRCLQEKPCEDAFAARLKEVLALFVNADMAALAETMRTQIAEEVDADPRKESNNFQDKASQTIQFIQDRPAQIALWLSSHGY